MMTTETVSVDWIRDLLFVLHDRNGFPIVMTQPSGVSGADLLPLSIIGCALWDVGAILKRQRQPVTGLRATAESLRDDEPPWRFRRIHIHYTVTGCGLDEGRVQRAIALSEEKYCSTHATLRDAVEIVSDYELVERDSAEIAGPAANEEEAVRIVLAFNDALNAHDLDAMMRLMTADCVFENTYPGPDGTSYEGAQAVRTFWEAFFRASRQPRFEVEEAFGQGNRCVMRWTYHWTDESGAPGHVRGVDIIRLRNGLITEKLSYVKG